MHDIWSSGCSHSRLLEHLGLARKQWWWLVVVADSELASTIVEPIVRADLISGILRLTWQASRLKVLFSHLASLARIRLSSGALAFSVTKQIRSINVSITHVWSRAGFERKLVQLTIRSIRHVCSAKITHASSFDMRIRSACFLSPVVCPSTRFTNQTRVYDPFGLSVTQW